MMDVLWRLVVPAAVVAFVCAAIATAQMLALRLPMVAAAEDLFDAAELDWQRAITAENASHLRVALDMYEQCIALQRGNVLTVPTLRREAPTGPASAFVGWLVQPLRLRVLHRIAAASELLRMPSERIVQAHAALIAEGYCAEVHAERPSDGAHATSLYARCLAPLARGTILFASSASEATSAFAAAQRMLSPHGGVALTWTSRWQLPDRHVPGLRARPWWDDHPAIRALEANYEALLGELDALSATEDGGGFTRRRGDAWQAAPKEGWGTWPLLGASAQAGRARRHCAIATLTCSLMGELHAGRSAGQTDPSAAVTADALAAHAAPHAGAGYYRLLPGTRLWSHAGPTNERLTCHLALRGRGAWLTVGEEEAREWQPGRAFCTRTRAQSIRRTRVLRTRFQRSHIRVHITWTRKNAILSGRAQALMTRTYTRQCMRVRRSASCCWWTCHIRTSCESRLRAETMGANELLVCTSCAEAHSSRVIGYSSVSTITAYRLSCNEASWLMLS
jgi:hypothetical protein